MLKINSTKTNPDIVVKVACHGEAGAGKTTLCATTGGNPLILSAEGGLLSLRHHALDYVEVRNMDDAREVHAFLAGGKHTYDWVCIDSLTEVADVLLAHELGVAKDPRQAYGELYTQLPKLVRAYRDLPLNVYMTCESEIVEGQYRPGMPGNKMGGRIPYFFDEVFALRVATDPQGAMVRKLQCQPSATHVAKDRSGALDTYEEPNLSSIRSKILAPSPS